MKREKLVKLKSELKHSTDAAEKSNNDSKMMEDKMNSAVKNGREIEKLIETLLPEFHKWSKYVKELNKLSSNVLNQCAMSAAITNYLSMLT
ncbi:hypothetical protein GJ496_011503, partial [Pomphorhynchus laevis]